MYWTKAFRITSCLSDELVWEECGTANLLLSRFHVCEIGHEAVGVVLEEVLLVIVHADR